MKILFVVATPFEVAPLADYLNTNFELAKQGFYKKENLQIKILVTGPGINHTTYHLTKELQNQKFDLVINVGIAGAFNRKLNIGDVLHVISDRFADLGIEEADGCFTDIHELGLIDPNEKPFTNGEIMNIPNDFSFLPKATAITVNKVHGQISSIEKIHQKYNADLESMEGAAFSFVCQMEKLPFLQIRSISNYVESRNKENWNLPKAITELNKTLLEMIETFL